MSAVAESAAKPVLPQFLHEESARLMRHTVLDVPYRAALTMSFLLFPDNSVADITKMSRSSKLYTIQSWKRMWRRNIGDPAIDEYTREFQEALDAEDDITALAEEARANACRIWRESIVDYGIRAILATSDEDAVAGRWHDSVKDVIGDR